MVNYIAIIHKEPKSDYGVSFPDFPGCITAGSDLEEARAMAQEALEFHLRGMREDGEFIPAPSSLDAIRAAKMEGDLFFLVSVSLPKEERVQRVNITLPESLLKKIDRHVEDFGMTRSGFLASAAAAKMADVWMSDVKARQQGTSALSQETSESLNHLYQKMQERFPLKHLFAQEGSPPEYRHESKSALSKDARRKKKSK